MSKRKTIKIDVQIIDGNLQALVNVSLINLISNLAEKTKNTIDDKIANLAQVSKDKLDLKMKVFEF